MLKINFTSIKKRWLVSVLMPVALLCGVVMLVSGLIIHSLYLDKVESAAEEYAKTFMLLGSTDSQYFVSAAQEYCEQFENKDRIEIMILDRNGNFVVSTSGFDWSGLSMPDYEKALTASDRKATWTGKSSVGEPILAGTILLGDANSGNQGAVRYLVSLTPCNARIMTLELILFSFLLCIMLITAYSGWFLIRSVVRPVSEVSLTARKLAAGDFSQSLTYNRQDEIGELCESIQYMATELGNAESLKNDFISSVSHELRTPLTAIKGWAETAKLSVGTDDDLVVRGLDVVLGESERLSGLVEELLDFSRIQNGRLVMNKRPFELGTVLEAAVNMYTELAKKRNIEVVYEPCRTPQNCFGDPDRIKQVFINIIDNAVKYSGDNGQVLIAALPEEGCVRIIIKDAGIGIPAADLDHVKEKFYKANKTVRGSGIGLAVADEIVKQHSGLLFVESSEGVGTTVTVVLPTVTVEETPTQKVIPAQASAETASKPSENPAGQAESQKPE